jgi:hypothetical protein
MNARITRDTIKHPIPPFLLEMIGIQINGGREHGFRQVLADRIHVDRRTIFRWLMTGTPNPSATERVRDILPRR